jgi:F1F0 ATPase subunit 2
MEMDASSGDQAMMTDPTFRFAVYSAIGLIAGLIIGLTHFVSLRWNARLFATGSAGAAVALQLGRIAVTVGALSALVLVSLSASLFGAIGFLVVRALVLRYLGEQP